MTRRTPLFDLHQKLGARIVDFGGWDMPLQYGSQIAEHHAVRRTAGVFDVSHMCVVDLKGRVRSPVRSTTHMCETSKTPAVRRTAWCSAICEPYCSGMSQPPKSTILAPSF